MAVGANHADGRVSVGLPPRLRPLGQWALAYPWVADIGSGDGRLAVWLANRGVAVTATEATPERTRRLQQQVGMVEVEVRCGDGLTPVAGPPLPPVAVIAGLGGAAIAAILERGRTIVPHMDLVLQPAQAYWRLRSWIRIGGGQIVAAQLARQGSRVYPCIVVRFPGAPVTPADAGAAVEDWLAPEFAGDPAYRQWLAQVAVAVSSSSRDPALGRLRRAVWLQLGRGRAP